MDTVLILGASGGFGKALVKAMAANNWRVTAVSRSGISANAVEQNPLVTWIKSCVTNNELMMQCAYTADVIVHAINEPNPNQHARMIDYTRQIIALAKAADAHLLFVGNIYSVGIPTNGIVNEHTPDAPVIAVGHLRKQLETMLAEATENGLRCTTMRFGSFIGPDIKTQNQFNCCIKSLNKGVLTVLGAMDISHSWAYLPDAARTMEHVARVRLHNNRLPAYMEIPFEGHHFSFAELKSRLESILGKTLKVTSRSWLLYKLLGSFLPYFRDLYSARYVWENSIRIDGSSLIMQFGSVASMTPLNDALKTIIDNQRARA